MKRLPLIVFFTACFAWNNAFALSGAGDAAVVSKLGAIFSQLKKEYETVLKQLREAQAQSQTLVDMKNTYRQVRAEYYFVKNFNLFFPFLVLFSELLSFLHHPVFLGV